MHRIFNGLDHFLDGKELNPALGLDLRHIIFIGTVVLASGNQHGVPDRFEDDLGVDAFFLAQCLDGLKNRFQSALGSNSDIGFEFPACYHSNFK